MRRFFVRYGGRIFLAIILCTCIVAGIAIASAKEKANDVVYDLHCYYGDASLLNGLNLTATRRSGELAGYVSEEVIWQTEISISDAKTECTSESFVSKDWRKDRRIEGKNFPRLFGDLSVYYYSTQKQDGVYRIVDYLEEQQRYYDLQYYDALRDNEWEEEGPMGMYDERNSIRLRHLFEIPMLEDEHWIVDGKFSYLDEEGDYGDHYSAVVHSATTENWYAIWMNNKTVHGNYVDFSQVKGGYGVYLLPVKREWKGNATYANCKTVFDMEGFCNVCPLSESSVIWDVTFSKDEKSLYILTVEEDNNAYLTVIDIPSQTVIATVKAFAFYNGKLKKNQYEQMVRYDYSWNSDENQYLVSTENGCVIQTLDEILLIHPNAEGQWEIAMDIAVPTEEEYKEGWDLSFDRKTFKETTGCNIESLRDAYVSEVSVTVKFDNGNTYCYDGERLVMICEEYEYIHLAVFRNNELQCSAVLTNANRSYFGTVKGALR